MVGRSPVRISTVCSALPILPISVSSPVVTTSVMPWPSTTRVPEKTAGRSGQPGRDSRESVADSRLRTGTDFPVSSDSSTVRWVDQRSSALAGVRSPFASTSRSPRTTAALAKQCRVFSITMSLLDIFMGHSWTIIVPRAAMVAALAHSWVLNNAERIEDRQGLRPHRQTRLPRAWQCPG